MPRSIGQLMRACATAQWRLVAAALCALCPVTFAATGDGIAFHRDHSIWYFHQGTPIRVTDNSSGDHLPSWSPDRTKIGFQSFRRGNSNTGNVWVIDLLSGTLTQVTDDQAHDAHPAWSPDGRHIAFVSDARGTTLAPALWMVELTTGMLTQLTADGPSVSAPAWSPDGRHIAFHLVTDGEPSTVAVWTVEVETGTVVQRTHAAVSDMYPSWSPDGSQIAFISDGRAATTTRCVWAIDAMTGVLTQLTDDAGDEVGRVSWSPNGENIAFASASRDSGPTDSIYLKAVNDPISAGYTRITDDAFDDSGAAWGPPTPVIEISDHPLATGVVTVGSAASTSLQVYNTGGGTLSVTEITSDNPQFAAAPTSFSLEPGESEAVDVVFRPSVVGWERTRLTFQHNAGTPVHAQADGIGRVDPPIGDLSVTKIAYTPFRQFTIATMDIDGLNPVVVTDDDEVRYDRPKWSPMATHIVADVNAQGSDERNDIVIMRADGTGQINLTNTPYRDEDAALSPDGKRLVFTSYRHADGNEFGIYVSNADASGQVRVSALGDQPDWSPDGAKIAFRGVDAQHYLYIVGSDGSNLTTMPFLDTEFPAWSPDGSKIAYGDDNDILVVDADGSNPVNLTNTAAIERHPSWSPDGTHIVFTSSHEGDPGIFRMRADGSQRTFLVLGSFPTWSPFPGPGIAVSSARANAGTSLVVAGHGFGPSETVTVQIAGESAVTVLADMFGSFQASVTVMNERPHGSVVGVEASSQYLSQPVVSSLIYDSEAEATDIVVEPSATVHVGDTISVTGVAELNATVTFSIAGIVGATDVTMLPTSAVAPPGFAAMAGEYAVTGEDADVSDAAVTVTVTDLLGNTATFVTSSTVTVDVGVPIEMTVPRNASPDGLLEVVVSLTGPVADLDAVTISLRVTPAVGVFTYDHIDVSKGLLVNADAIPNATDLSAMTFLLNLPGVTGLSGSGELARFYFRGVGATDDEATFSVTDVMLARVDATAITSYIKSEPVTVTLGCPAGDANGDGAVNVLDVTKIERIVARLDEIPASACPDANQDGATNVLDVTSTERLVVGLPAVAPAPQAARAPEVTVFTVSDTGDVVTLQLRLRGALRAVDAASFELAYASSEYEVVSLEPVGWSTDASRVSNDSPGQSIRVVNESGLDGDSLAGSIAEIRLRRKLRDASRPITLDTHIGDTSGRSLLLRSFSIPMWRIPEQTAALPNFPNPFNPETWIPFDLADSASVTVTIYSPTGQAIRTVDLGRLPAGPYRKRSRAAYWDGRNAAGELVGSGVYFYRLRADGFSSIQRMLILK